MWLPCVIALWSACTLTLASTVPTSTIIDVLSSNAQFSQILQLIQARGLVPFFNSRFNSTFLAPINSAFAGVDTDAISAEQILYHFVNANVMASDIEAEPRLYYTYLDNGSAPISLGLRDGVNMGAATFGDVDLLASPQRGVVHCVLSLLEIPLPLENALFVNPELSDFASLVDFAEPNLNHSLLLVPENEVLSGWLANSTDGNTAQPLLRYLQSPHGNEDARALVQRHRINEFISAVGANNSLPLKLSLADGTEVKLTTDLRIEGPNFVTGELCRKLKIARNAVYLPLTKTTAADEASTFLKLTPEKLILGLGGYSMVRELSLYGHSGLIDGSMPDDRQRTIVVPSPARQHAFNVAEENPGSIILYQFLEGLFPKSKQSTLLDTQMPLKSGKYVQRVHYERRASGGPSLNWEKLDSTPYVLGNTTFYTSHDLITPPPSLAMALGPMLVSSYSLSFLDKLDRLQLPHENSYTVLVPNRESWEKNILLKYYLDRNTTALTRVFDNLILKAPVYSDLTSPVLVQQFGGLKTNVSWDADFNIFTLCNSDIRKRISAEVTNALFNNGVAHVVDDIPLPTTLEISTVDLISAGKREFFVELLRAAGMENVLEPSANFTVLVPPVKDLRRNNYTTATDKKRLRAMLELHLLPNNPLEDLLTSGGTAATLAGEELEAQSIGSSSKLLGLAPKSATEGQRVLLYKYGFTNGVVAAGSSVVFTDRHISPLWITPMKFGLRRGTYTILGVLLGLLMASVLVFVLLLWISKTDRDPLVMVENGGVQPYRDDPEADLDAEAEQEAGTDADTEQEDEPHSQPIETPSVSDDRAYGRHLGLQG